MSAIIQSKYGKYGLAAVGVLLIGLGAYLIITHLVGVIEGSAGILLVLVGILLLDYAGR